MEILPVLIIGTNTEALLVADILLQLEIVVYGFLTSNKKDSPESYFDIPILGNWDEKPYQKMAKNEKINYFVAETDPDKRKKCLQIYFDATQKLPMNVIHPQAVVAPSANLAAGNLIGSLTSIQPYTSMESGNFISSNVVIESGTKMGHYNKIQSGVVIGQDCKIGDEVFIGHGAVIYPKVSIGSNAVIGAGSVVMRDVPANKQVFGNPAQII